MIRRVFIAAVLTALIASVGYAQRGGGGGEMGGGGMGRGGGRGPQVDKAEVIADDLKLSPEQKTAMIAIMDSAQKQADQVLTKIVANKQQILELSVEGKDTAEATKQLGMLNAAMLGVEVDAFTQTLAKLDAKQKSKGPKLFEDMTGMFTAQGGWHRSN
jgi:Spy/CpxP family protein refolding chaperone